MSVKMNWDGPNLRQVMLQAANDAVNAVAIDLQRTTQKTLNKGASNRSNPNASSSAPGQPPHKMTGTLARSIQIEKIDRGINPAVKVGTALPYGRIHEYGGTIKAKGNGWLKIPVSADAKRAEAGGGSLTHVGGKKLFFVKSNVPGKLLLASSNGGQLDIHYVLQKSVRMPARPYVRPAVQEVTERIDRLVQPHLDRALRRLNA